MLGHWLTKTMLQEITRSSKDECSTGDQTIILGLQILVHERSSSMLHVDRWIGWMDGWMVIIGYRSSVHLTDYYLALKFTIIDIAQH